MPVDVVYYQEYEGLSNLSEKQCPVDVVSIQECEGLS